MRVLITLSVVAGLATLPVASAQAYYQNFGDWTAVNSPGDKVGAAAYGEYYVQTVYQQGDREYLQGWIKDTASDGYGARVKFRTIYLSGFERNDHVDTTGGYNSAESYLFTYDYRQIWRQEVQECLLQRTSTGGLKEYCATGWKVLLS